MITIHRFNPGLRTLSASLLALALLAAPCQAVTRVETAVAAPAVLLQGVIQEMAGGALRINGKAYQLSSATSALFDRSGAPVTAARLAVGKTVAISVVADGSQLRIKELWLID
jgi:hypothetical protein